MSLFEEKRESLTPSPPPWVNLGEAAGIAAAMTAGSDITVQEVDIEHLQQ